MNRIYLFVIVVFLILLATQQNTFSSEGPKFERWEKDIQAFEQWDSKNFFPADAVLFIGSSSIKGWKTREYFPQLPVINRGFGGSDIEDSTHFADRIIFPYKPAAIVLYAGDNDIAGGKTAQRVFDDYKKFVKQVNDKAPGTPVIFIAIKPSTLRWKLWPEMKKANMMVKEFTTYDERLFYFDSAEPLMGSNGRPKDELFMTDKLHLNSKGYHAWTEKLRPIIEQALKCGQKR